MKKIIIIFYLFFICSVAQPATYYISPSGDNGNGGTSCVDAYKTFSYAQDSTRFWCGDILRLCDGTYNSDEGGISVEMSCTSGNEATFTADNDGGAVVDGDYARTPFVDNGNDYIIVEGIYFKESRYSTVNINGDNNIFRRVTASDVYNPEDNYHVWIITGDDVLLEDCAGWGNGRNILLPLNCRRPTVRRFWAQYDDKQSSHGPRISQIYDTSGALYENYIATWDQDGEAPRDGVGIWDYDNMAIDGDNIRIIGSVTYDILKSVASNWNAGFGIGCAYNSVHSGEFKNNVTINTGRGIAFCCDPDHTIKNNTIVDAIYGITYNEMYCSRGGVDSGATITNNVIIDSTYGIVLGNRDDTCNGSLRGTISHSYNNYYNNTSNYDGTSAQTGDETFNPVYDTATYGYGAYLIQPSALDGEGISGENMGAEVLYRYEDEVLTDVPLWPWPMEDRILSESGVSPTYSEDQGSGESGGLWKTLNGVYGPRLSDLSPNSLLSCGSDPETVTISLTSDVNANCKYSAFGTDTCSTSYANLDTAFTTGQGGTSHSTSVNQACGANTDYVIKCQDVANGTDSTCAEINVDVAAAAGVPPQPAPMSIRQGNENAVMKFQRGGGNMTIRAGSN